MSLIPLFEASIELTINGKKYTVGPDVPKTTSLLRFLRDYANLRGTKGCCYEGGCGVCITVATFVDPETSKLKTCSVNSCLILVYSCSGWIIETIESLGDRYNGYSKLQKVLSRFYGTQCGYCSPGFIMTMHGAQKSSPALTIEQVEKSLDGNLCRCTGYRPILDAFKSLAIDAPKSLKADIADIEDSHQATCPKTGETCKGTCSDKDHGSDNSCSIKTPPIEPVTPPFQINGKKWFRPITLSELYEALRGILQEESYMIVVGNTGQGVYKNDDPFDVYVDSTAVPELYSVTMTKPTDPLVIGSNVSLQRCIQVFKEKGVQSPGFSYLLKIADHWEFVANTAVRNVGSWAGNLMLKYKHQDFPSDLFLTLATCDVTISVGHASNAAVSDVNLEEFLTMEMDKKVIISMKLVPMDENIETRFYKITPRAVNAHAYVNCGIKIPLNKTDGYKVVSKPTIIFGGISQTFIHASKSEGFLITRQLNDLEVLSGAVKLIGEEVKPDDKPENASQQYRISLAQSLFYKTILSILVDVVSHNLASGATILQRPISSGAQTYDPNEDTWPIGKPIPKVESAIQIAGEAEYVDDIEASKDELFGAFVQSSFARATLGPVDPSVALSHPGVVAYVDSKDIPGVNSFFEKEDPIFASGHVSYAGQAIGLVVAETREIAKSAAKMVKAEYLDKKTPRLTLESLIPPNPTPSPPKPSTSNQVDPNSLEGKMIQGNQFHFHMEPQVARVVPVEDGYDVYATTQNPNDTQKVISAALNIPNNSINLSVRRLGGGFGAKISRGNVVACAAAVASHKLQKPVRITLDLTANMTLVGWRDTYLNTYKVTFTNDGTLENVDVNLTGDPGYNSNEAPVQWAYIFLPSVYTAKKWTLNPVIGNTDTAANTWCRTPAAPNAIAVMENIIERIAHHLKRDPAAIRETNFIHSATDPNKTKFAPKGENLVRTKIFPMLKQMTSYDKRRAEIIQFNKENRWKKKGLSMLPVFYALNYNHGVRFNVHVVIYANDGTVVISHGGIEMGQGINTKAVQVAAQVLGIPMANIKIKPTDLTSGANSGITGGSTTSDAVAHGVEKCCLELKSRVDAVAKTLKEKTTWQELCVICHRRDVDLTTTFWTTLSNLPGGYDIFAAACLEVELDVLTGNYIITRADIIEDCGRSLSPYVDIGQIEGAFMMGIGLWTTEKVIYDTVTGQKLSNGTWNYKIPTALDIPVDFRVTLLPKGDNKAGVLRSKATGEPPLCLSYVVVTALRQAIASAREDGGVADWFEIETPLTVERIQQLCRTKATEFVLTSTIEASTIEASTIETSTIEATEKLLQDFHVVETEEVPRVNDQVCVMN